MSTAPRLTPSVLGLCVLLFVAGCSQRVERTLRDAPPPASPGQDAAYLKAHLENGDVVIFSTWRTAAEDIEGEGRRLGVNREVVDEGILRVPLSDVVIYETNELRPSASAIALGIITGASAALTVYCLTNTKACFGSCPTFYAPTGEGETLLAEGFSGSVAPALEATDVDGLYGARLAGSRFEVTMKNEALETHVVRHADLLLVPSGSGEQVWVEEGTGFVTGNVPITPTACSAEEGDCRAALAAADGTERLSLADSTDLAARETIDLAFDLPSGHDVPAEGYGLVLTSRQSLVTTFLFYQMLAYMGRDVGDWFAHLETAAREATARGERMPLGLVDELGGIEVLVEDESGEWVAAGVVDEHGPLATNRHLVRLPVPEGGTLRVRLRLARGAWRLDAASLVALGEVAAPLRVVPSSVRRDGAEDPDALRRLLDPAETLVTLPGDSYTLVYDLPEQSERYMPFVESRGYYLEWMREEWMAEEDPVAAALLVYDPVEALRQLAPQYKRLEPHMERAFWNSRYVRP